MSTTVTALRCEHLCDPLGLDMAEPRLSWQLQSPAREVVQSAWQVQVADAGRGFAGELLWDSGRSPGERSHLVPYAGSALDSHRRCTWRVRVWDQDGSVSPWSEAGSFAMGFLGAESWPGRWMEPDVHKLPAVAALRREWRQEVPIREARLYCTARGCADVLLNGTAVCDEYFSPGWTDYRVRLPYRCWDVTGLLREGINCIGVLLGDGWYSGPLAWEQRRGCYGTFKAVRIALRIEDQQGTVHWIAGDEQWRWGGSGILEASFLNGERHDATLVPIGWSEPGFADSAWAAVQHRNGSEVPITWHAGPPVRAIAEFPVREWWQPRPGAWIGDCGQNIAGFARLRVQAPAGTVLRLRFAEVLTADRQLYVDNLRSAVATDEYVCAGQGVEEWSPRFTFHGFQYVEVTGLPGRPDEDTLVAVALSSDCPVAGRFRCDHPLVERIASNAVWTQRANYLEVPTDCPQRDERLGWTGDAQAYLRTAICFHDVAGFHAKWLQDLDDATLADGRAPSVAPRVPGTVDWDADAAWGDATTICPWVFYRCYDDERQLRQRYGMMRRYLQYYRDTRLPGRHVRYDPPQRRLALRDGGSVPAPNLYGDWLAVQADTAAEIIRTAFYAESCRLVRDAARVLGEVAEAERLEAEWQAIRADFVFEFVTPDGRIRGRSKQVESQTGYVLALHFDLLPEELRGSALAHLVADLEVRDWHLSTGFVGLPYLLPVLSRFGRSDVAYRLLLNETYPSWGYEIAHGATTIWERWNGYHHEHGPGDANMNSYSHYAYGAVCEWLFSDVAGIELLEPGFRRFRVRPRVDGPLGEVEASHDCVAGRIAVTWRRSGDRLGLVLTVPANTRAIVELPSCDDTWQLDDDATMATAAGSEVGLRACEVGSGTWRFTVSLHADPAAAPA